MRKKIKKQIEEKEAMVKESFEKSNDSRWSGWEPFVKEFEEHLPFAIVVSFLALGLVALLEVFQYRLGEGLFDQIHFIHLFFSAAATSIVYSHYKKNFFAALIIGVLGAIVFGSLSDIFLPYSIANIFGLAVHFHLPLIESTAIVLGIAAIGAISGWAIKKNHVPHSIHVFLSVFASLFYIINYVSFSNFWVYIITFFILVFAVWLPCCLSDIIFPMIFASVSHKHS